MRRAQACEIQPWLSLAFAVMHLNAASDLVDKRAYTCTAKDNADAADILMNPAMSTANLGDVNLTSSAIESDLEGFSH